MTRKRSIKRKRQFVEQKKEAKKKLKGEASENSVIRALTLSDKEWIISIRKSGKKEDRNGIDLVLKTIYMEEEIKIPIQVKSSYKGLKNHIEKNKGKTYIPCIIIKSETPDFSIVKSVKNARYQYIKRVIREKLTA